jgi:hypothetical protein
MTGAALSPVTALSAGEEKIQKASFEYNISSPIHRESSRWDSGRCLKTKVTCRPRLGPPTLPTSETMRGQQMRTGDDSGSPSSGLSFKHSFKKKTKESRNGSMSSMYVCMYMYIYACTCTWPASRSVVRFLQ